MPAKDLYEHALHAAEIIGSKINVKPTLALFLGTGSAQIIQFLQVPIFEIDYGEIPHMHKASVESHQNKLIVGNLHGSTVMIWTGRLHYYEGYSMDQITFPIRVTKQLGVNKVLFTNAAGGINQSYSPGDLVVISDHINLFPVNPLRGYNDERWGMRFPDMSKVYQKSWNEQAVKIAHEQGISIHEGVYAALPGPSLETPSEYQYLQTLGADLVGMSTVPEIIVAHQMGMQKSVISIVSNVVNPEGYASIETTLEQVITTVKNSLDKVNKLFKNWIPFLDED